MVERNNEWTSLPCSQRRVPMELTGVMMIKAYHNKRGDRGRTTMLVPDSAHGTNPATANVVGYGLKK